jgi:hypothetical protein
LVTIIEAPPATASTARRSDTFLLPHISLHFTSARCKVLDGGAESNQVTRICFVVQDWRDRGEKDVFIVKPKAGARGVGIRLVAKPDVQVQNLVESCII